MWLLTAVGPVHGQKTFTFALERKSYEIGRGKDCDIVFDDNHVRRVQGHIHVGDWDPALPHIKPEIRWKSERNNKDEFPAFTTLLPAEAPGSTDRADYDEKEVPAGTQGIVLSDEGGMGIELYHGDKETELSNSIWFCVHWQPFSLVYPGINGIKDAEGDDLDKLRHYCISYTSQFDETSPPDLVISEELRPNDENNMAVCFGIRIVKPNYIQALLARFTKCWKRTAADSQDSFCLPDAASEIFQPPLRSENLKPIRNSLAAWLPDPERKNMFAGWTIFGLKKDSKVPQERRWLELMGATYTDIDVTSQPPLSQETFKAQLSDWLGRSIAAREAGRALVVHFLGVKRDMSKEDFAQTVEGTCDQIGVTCVSGSILWGSVSYNGVDQYIRVLRGSLGHKAVPQTVDGIVGAQPASAINTQGSARYTPTSSAIPPSQAPFAIPSTFPEETEVVAHNKPVPQVKVLPSTQREQSASSGEQAALEPPTQSMRKPLRKRVAKPIELFGAEPSMIPETVVYNPPQPSAEASLLQREATVLQSYKNESESTTGTKSKLKRRAGVTETQSRSQFNFGFNETPERDAKKNEVSAEIRELYEQTKAESANALQPAKRRRLDSEDIGMGRDSRATSRSGDPDPDSQDTGMDVDEGEVEDPIQRQLRRAREARINSQKPPSKSTMGPPPPRTAKVAESVIDQPSKQTSKASQVSTQQSKKKKGGTEDVVTGETTKDDAFLQAITKASRTKKAVDELDKEFNNLRIPKANQKKQPEIPVWREEHPDYNLVTDFDNDLRGNFMKIIRKDMFRKDGGRKDSPLTDDGRPNFKKFKKKVIVRRDPVQLVLAGPTTNVNDAEMGEPYWTSDQPVRNGKQTQMSQIPASLDDDDHMPLLPVSNKRLLGTLREDSPDTEDSMTANKRRDRRSTQTATQSDFTQGRTNRASSRSTRATSVASEASSAVPISKAKSKPVARSKKPETIVIEDSEDEVANEVGRASARSSTARGSKRSSNGTRVPGTSVPGDAGDMPSSSKTTGRSGTRGTQASDPAPRRRLLVADDDDDDDTPVARGPVKKRRLG